MGYDNDRLLTAAGRFALTRNAANGLPEQVSAGSYQMNRAFNGYGEVEAAATLLSGSSKFSYDLTRNNSGRITAKHEQIEGTSSQFAYFYDSVGRLLTVTKNGLLVEEYRYDNNGNRTSEMNELRGISGRTSAHSIEDHTLAAGPVSYEFDYDDNFTARRGHRNHPISLFLNRRTATGNPAGQYPDRVYQRSPWPANRQEGGRRHRGKIPLAR